MPGETDEIVTDTKDVGGVEGGSGPGEEREGRHPLTLKYPSSPTCYTLETRVVNKEIDDNSSIEWESEVGHSICPSSLVDRGSLLKN